MDRSRDFGNPHEATKHANNMGYRVDTSVDGQHYYAYDSFTGQTRYSLEMNAEGLFYWEIY